MRRWAGGLSAWEVKTEALVTRLARDVAAILTPRQVELLEWEIAPSADQPWRLYARGLPGAKVPKAGRTQLPSDAGRWLKLLRDVREQVSAEDPAAAVEALTRRLIQDLNPETPGFAQAEGRARAFAVQAVLLSLAVYSQREWGLAQAAVTLTRDSHNEQQKRLRREIETFHADRWLVEVVLLSPRAVTTLRELGGRPLSVLRTPLSHAVGERLTAGTEALSSAFGYARGTRSISALEKG